MALSLLLSGNAFAGCKKGFILKNGKCEFDYSKYVNKKKPWYKKLDVSSYFEKRKECKEFADRAETVYMGKQRYKSCMEE